MAPDLRRIDPPTLPDAASQGYAQVVTCAPGRMVFVSGQVAMDAEGTAVPGGHGAQAERVARNLRLALEAAGATPADVVSLRAFVVGLTPERLAEVMPPFVALFGGPLPAVTGVGVAALAAPDLLVEVEAVAVV